MCTEIDCEQGCLAKVAYPHFNPIVQGLLCTFVKKDLKSKHSCQPQKTQNLEIRGLMDIKS